MLISYRSYFFHFVCITVWNLASTDYIPTILWNMKGNALQIKPVPALGRSDKVMSETLKNIHLQEFSIVVFSVNELSLEDLAKEKLLSRNNTLSNIETFLDTQPNMLLPSVKDPLDYIHKAHCGVQEIVVDNKIDESVMQSVSSALQRSCVVILHIPDDGIVVKESEIKSVFQPSFENSDSNIIGIFTGVKSSWAAQNNDRHISRNLLAAPPSESNFVNITGCLIMYAENATITYNNNSAPLIFPPATEGSSCGNSSVLVLKFVSSGAVTSATLKLNFKRRGLGWNTTATVQVAVDKGSTDEIDLKTDYLEAPIGFSYSCGDLVLKNKTFNVTLKFDGFQVQPFEVKEVFSDSFDCVPYFTVPIWMGIFVSLLFIIITNIGVYALFSVRTMDRFDDPKGKTISVSTTAD